MMNVLFALYGGFDTNSAIPLCIHAHELQRRGHRCTVAIPQASEAPAFIRAPRTVLYEQALEDPASLFDDNRPADILHAWTPRENVRDFVTRYQSARPTPWLIYLEDNEAWIARTALAAVKFPSDRLLEHADDVISSWTPPGMPHPLRFGAFVGLADAAAVIQDKLAVEVPPWVPCATVMPGVDLEHFAPRDPPPGLRQRFGVKPGEHVVVYPGGLNDFTRPGLEALCRAVGLVNAAGVPCRLLRSGPVPLDFLDRLPAAAANAISDVGVLPRDEMPDFLALADAFVQPGMHDPFEDLRLPGKLPELFACGRPVVLPDTNIAHLLRDGVDAVLHRTGTPEEMAARCVELFTDPARAKRIGEAGRLFAQAHFDPAVQAGRLLEAYESAREAFDAQVASETWKGASPGTPVAELSSKHLRALAKSPRRARMDVGALLRAHATALDAAAERARGLEKGMAGRDETLVELRAQVEAFRAQIEHYGTLAHEFRLRFIESQRTLDALFESSSWKMTEPLRAVAAKLESLKRKTS